jgi:putative addiction module killer protein
VIAALYLIDYNKFMESSQIQVEIYETEQGKQPYVDWFNGVRDTKAQARLSTRITRLRQGNFGDSKPIGEGVIELRVDYGPGYRIYLGRDGDKLVILLSGSDKSDQKAAVKQAKEYWQDYRRR